MPQPTTPTAEVAADPGKALLEKYEIAEDPTSTGEPESEPAAPAAASTTPPPSVPASVANDAPKHPASLVARARKAGFDDDDLADLSTDDLRDAVSQRQAERAATAAAERVLNAAGRPIDPVTKQFLPANQPAASAPEREEFQLGMTREEFEAAGVTGELHPVIQKALAPLAAELKALKADNARLLAEAQGRRQADHLDKADREFVKHPDLFGSGSRDDLDPKGDEWNRRLAVLRVMDTIPAGERTTFGKDFDRTRRLLFPAAAAPAPKPAPAAGANGTVPDPIAERMQNGHMLPPTQRAGKPAPKGVRRAEETVAAKMRDAAAANDGDTTEHDELPD